MYGTENVKEVDTIGSSLYLDEDHTVMNVGFFVCVCVCVGGCFPNLTNKHQLVKNTFLHHWKNTQPSFLGLQKYFYSLKLD